MKKRNSIITGASLVLILLTIMAITGIANAKERVEINASISIGRNRSIDVTRRSDLQIDVWTDQDSYYIGDSIDVYFHTNRDAYIYIFNTDTHGITRQIFPNYYDRENYVRRGVVYTIPDRGYSLEVTGPGGREYIRAIAVTERRDFLRRYESFSESEPFPRLPQGVESFREKLGVETIPESEKAEDETRARLQERERVETGERVRVEPESIRVRPGYREYAESYTSFYVRNRWYDGWSDDRYRRGDKRIRIISYPDDASIYIDGRFYGLTARTVRLTFGPHTIRIRRSGYHDWVRSIFVDEYSPDRMVAELDRSRYRYWTPYQREWDMDFHRWEKEDLKDEREEKSLEERQQRGGRSLEDRRTGEGESTLRLGPKPDIDEDKKELPVNRRLKEREALEDRR